MTEGLFVALEGGEGAGKSTQAARLEAALSGYGLDVVKTREPGATVLGSGLRSLLFLPGKTPITPRAEAMIYAADRAQHVDTVILPALLSRKIVITDRYYGSTVAYQVAGHGLPHYQVERVNRWAMDGVRPHLTLFLDLDPKVGLRRAKDRNETNRYEDADLAFHQKVHRSFTEQARANDWSTVDASQSSDAVHGEILRLVLIEAYWFKYPVPKPGDL